MIAIGPRKGIAVFLFVLALPTSVAALPDKTPDDVFRQVFLLSEEVQALRQMKGVTEPWPVQPFRAGKQPRHVFQKALEVLGKINRYRVIKGMGGISIPLYPGREITPNEVFALVTRLEDEVHLLLPHGRTLPHEAAQPKGKTPSDVYKALWETSRAMDPVLGIRGFSPSDVYAQTQHILEIIRFLRRTKNLPDDVAKPALQSGHHPNHALAAAYRLQEKIAQAEKALGMESMEVPTVPRRVITPTDVYDATGTILAELQRIEFRLGLDQRFLTPPPQPGKTPDDVLQNLEWATRMMPPLSAEGLRDLPPKTANEVFDVALHILREFEPLFKTEGVSREKAPSPPPLTGMQSRHVYLMGMKVLEKINLLRRQSGLGPMAVPRTPLRIIDAAETHDLLVRVDLDLEIYYRHRGLPTVAYHVAQDKERHRGKTPNDVYGKLWVISHTIDLFLSDRTVSPTELFMQAQMVLDEARSLGSDVTIPLPPLRSSIETKDLFALTGAVLDLLNKGRPEGPLAGVVRPADVFNRFHSIRAELSDLKLRLGLTERPDPPERPLEEKTAAQVYQVLEQARMVLETVLEGNRRAFDPPL